MRRAVWIGIAAGALGGAAWWLVRASRAFVERAPYLIRRQAGRFEVREYPTLSVATVSTRTIPRGPARERLRWFLERANARGEKIARTAPVLIEPALERLSMVMPIGTESRGVPAPIDALVTIDQRPGGYVATYRFPGRPTEENERRAAEVLRRWVTAEGLEPAAQAEIIAYYDAPWLPGPIRRNEVMLRLANAERA